MAQPKQEPKTFEEFLAERKKGAKEFDWAEVRRLWEKQARSLVELVLGWLEPLAAKGLVQIERVPWQVNEAELGTYELPALSLRFPGSPLVVLRPVGRNIIGAAGRYDLECGPEKYHVLLSGKGQWRIAHSTRRDKPAPLDQDAFEAAAKDLVSV